MKYKIDSVVEAEKDGVRIIRVRFSSRELVYSGVIELDVAKASKEIVDKEIKARLKEVQAMRELGDE